MLHSDAIIPTDERNRYGRNLKATAGKSSHAGMKIDDGRAGNSSHWMNGDAISGGALPPKQKTDCAAGYYAALNLDGLKTDYAAETFTPLCCRSERKQGGT